MSESRKLPAEYGNVPESSETREFVYWNLLEYLNIDKDSELRPGGMRRGSRHTAALDDLHEFLHSRALINNELTGSNVTIARATLPKILLELSLLKNASAAYMYDRIAFFEARVYELKDPSMNELDLKAAGYKEEYAEGIFSYSPTPGK